MQQPKYHLNQQVLFKSVLNNIETHALGIIRTAYNSGEYWLYQMDSNHNASTNITLDVHEERIIAFLTNEGEWDTV